MKRYTVWLLVLIGIASANTWSDPLPIVNTDAKEFSPGPMKHGLLVTPDNTVHFVYFSDQDEPGNREIYYMSYNGSWSEPLRLSNAPYRSHEPTMAIDGDGNITVVWYDYRLNDPYPDLFYCRYDAASGVWSEDQPFVVVPDGSSVSPVIVAEPSGKVHCFWLDWRYTGRRNELFYTYWEDGMWAPEVPLTDVGVLTRAAPTMTLDDYGNLHLFWADERTGTNDWFVYYSKMTPDGQWGEEVLLGRSGPLDVEIVDNMLYLLHWYQPYPDSETSQLMYSVKDLAAPDDEWLVQGVQINDRPTTDALSGTLAVDGNGVRVVWLDGVKYKMENLYQATLNLQSRTIPENIGPLDGLHRRPSMVAGPTGNLYLTYVYTDESEEDWNIYFRCDLAYGIGNENRTVQTGYIDTVYPNPTNGEAFVTLEIRVPQEVEVAVYDTAGRRVDTVYQGYLTAGRHQLRVDAEDLASGTYFINAEGDELNSNKPLVVVR